MVEHESSSCRFLLPLESNEVAYIQYRIQDDGVWECYHTEVPESQRGQGLGGVLAKVKISYYKLGHSS